MKKLGKTIATLLAVALLAGAAGCHTVRGVGRDVQSGGQALEEAADDVQHNK